MNTKGQRDSEERGTVRPGAISSPEFLRLFVSGWSRLVRVKKRAGTQGTFRPPFVERDLLRAGPRWPKVARFLLLVKLSAAKILQIPGILKLSC